MTVTARVHNHSITLPADVDVIETLLHWSQKQVARLEKKGIRRHRLIFDPGLGFGKTSAQSGQIIERVIEIKNCGLPLFIGHSRKSFLRPSPLEGEGRVGGSEAGSNATNNFLAATTPLPNPLPQGERGFLDAATLAVSRQLIGKGVKYLRVHDVAAHRVLLEEMHG